ncbi:MAG: family 20 glycosylhydrolase [Alteromonadales bacterium]|nr:family 20 glycosylhydrolase [Alteromonadales bacterium]
MRKKILALTIAVSLSLIGCEQASQPKMKSAVQQNSIILHAANQQDIDNIAENLEVNYRVITNISSDKCNQKIVGGNCFEVELKLTAKTEISAKGWNIHFSQIVPIQSFESDHFNIKHLNGDLHRISLKDSFSGFTAGESKKIMFRARYWALSESEALPNYIVSVPGGSDIKARVIDSTRPTIDPDSGLETLPHMMSFTDIDKQFKRTLDDKTQWLTSEKLFERNRSVNSASHNDELLVTQAIVPTPKSVIVDGEQGFVAIPQGILVDYGNVKPASVNAALSRLTRLGIKQNKAGLPVYLSIIENEKRLIGSYQLSITDTAITLVGVDENGVFNGLQSLASLATVGSTRLPKLIVNDEPHYTFRGMLVDVARNFHSKDFILTLLDQMAAYKLNKLHLHLGDDEGWRLEIPSLPELTDIGSKRCFDPSEEHCLISQLGSGVDGTSSVSGYYSVSEYSEILRAATARHIQVIPSLDMPGHSRAAMKAMLARYKKYQASEDEGKAKQFLLDDLQDNTRYSSVQFYNDNTINVCLESSYDFVVEVMTQVKKIHADAGQPLTRYHIGADETAGAWVESPACKAFVANNDKGVTDMKELGAYFIERVAGILSELDIETAGWSDGMEHTRKENMPAIVQVNSWDLLFMGGHDKVHRLVNRDWQVVLSTPDVLYFDFPYEADPKEHGNTWGSRHTNTEKIFQFMPDNLPVHAEFWLDRQDHAYKADDTKSPMVAGKKFLGIQGQLWSEGVRTDDMVEHKVFPRLLALSERAWHLPDWAVPYNYQGETYSQSSNAFTGEMAKRRDSQWHLFANTLGQKEFTKLELSGVDYRLPTVGAIIKEDKLYANTTFPGLAIEYRAGTGQWHTYQKPVAVKSNIELRSRSNNGLRTSRITQVSLNK